MKKTSITVLITILITMSLMACVSYAGSINGNEESVIAAASGTFTYNGKSYVASSGSLAELRAYLASDDVDLTAAQASKAIGIIQGHVATGVSDGYLVPVGGSSNNNVNSGKQSKIKKDLVAVITSDEGAGGAGGVSVSGGSPAYVASPVIKNTGFSFNIMLLAGAVAILAVIAVCYVRTRKKSVRIAVPIVFSVVILVCLLALQAPVDNLFAMEFSSAVTSGDPSYAVDMANKNETVAGPVTGMHYGTISCGSIELKAPLFYGDTDAIFAKGAGQYTGSGIPGEGRAIIAGGHDLTFFKHLDELKKGQNINVTTTYGRYTYKVTGSRVARYSDAAAYTGLKGEVLVLYTCYPLGSVFGNRSMRLFVYCDKVSGPTIRRTATDD